MRSTRASRRALMSESDKRRKVREWMSQLTENEKTRLDKDYLDHYRKAVKAGKRPLSKYDWFLSTDRLNKTLKMIRRKKKKEVETKSADTGDESKTSSGESSSSNEYEDNDNRSSSNEGAIYDDDDFNDESSYHSDDAIGNNSDEADIQRLNEARTELNELQIRRRRIYTDGAGLMVNLNKEIGSSKDTRSEINRINQELANIDNDIGQLENEVNTLSNKFSSTTSRTPQTERRERDDIQISTTPQTSERPRRLNVNKTGIRPSSQIIVEGRQRRSLSLSTVINWGMGDRNINQQRFCANVERSLKDVRVQFRNDSEDILFGLKIEQLSRALGNYEEFELRKFSKAFSDTTMFPNTVEILGTLNSAVVMKKDRQTVFTFENNTKTLRPVVATADGLSNEHVLKYYNSFGSQINVDNSGWDEEKQLYDRSNEKYKLSRKKLIELIFLMMAYNRKKARIISSVTNESIIKTIRVFLRDEYRQGSFIYKPHIDYKETTIETIINKPASALSKNKNIRKLAAKRIRERLDISDANELYISSRNDNIENIFNILSVENLKNIATELNIENPDVVGEKAFDKLMTLGLRNIKRGQISEIRDGEYTVIWNSPYSEMYTYTEKLDLSNIKKYQAQSLSFFLKKVGRSTNYDQLKTYVTELRRGFYVDPNTLTRFIEKTVLDEDINLELDLTTVWDVVEKNFILQLRDKLSDIGGTRKCKPDIVRDVIAVMKNIDTFFKVNDENAKCQTKFCKVLL